MRAQCDGDAAAIHPLLVGGTTTSFGCAPLSSKQITQYTLLLSGKQQLTQHMLLLL